VDAKNKKGGGREKGALLVSRGKSSCNATPGAENGMLTVEVGGWSKSLIPVAQKWFFKTEAAYLRWGESLVPSETKRDHLDQDEGDRSPSLPPGDISHWNSSGNWQVGKGMAKKIAGSQNRGGGNVSLEEQASPIPNERGDLISRLFIIRGLRSALEKKKKRRQAGKRVTPSIEDAGRGSTGMRRGG